ncbi:hypothetical protein [Priestia megaterium]|uniref:hypothetical protein n=1 Tax=Priestia megaterium TaxID=1404 RepID=UPI000BFDFA6D|nr:hypothetical protein [Priestia megaterium]PGQ88228.1 hypothetical protein COA18_04695 [Priestia megaterium]
MVSNQILKERTVLSWKMGLIDKECIDQFIVGLLSWYQEYKPVQFMDEEIAEVPNLFQLFEYSSYAEPISNQFVDSDIKRTMRKMPQADYESVENQAIKVFNDRYHDFFEVMIADCCTVLDAYHLFYCYQDDAQNKAKFFNPYLKEVW